MLSRQSGPIAQKDESRNWIFTAEIMKAYSVSGLADYDLIDPGDEFQFLNGPYGSREFVVVSVGDFEIDGEMQEEVIIARDK